MEKTCIFCVSRFTFQDVIYNNKNLICNFVISTLSTQTLIQSQIDLGFHCFYLEITWKIHGILCHHRSGNLVDDMSGYRNDINIILTGFRGGMVQTNEQYEFVHQALCLYERELPDRPPSGDWEHGSCDAWHTQGLTHRVCNNAPN